MSANSFVKSMLFNELRWRTRLTDGDITIIVESFMEQLERRRHTIVPTYLTDNMYETQKSIDPDIEFNKANGLYKSALAEYNKQSIKPADSDETSGFW